MRWIKVVKRNGRFRLIEQRTGLPVKNKKGKPLDRGGYWIKKLAEKRASAMNNADLDESR